jgi:hypothetical protein
MQFVSPTAVVGKSICPLAACPVRATGLAPVHTIVTPATVTFVELQLKRGETSPCSTNPLLTEAVNVGTGEHVDDTTCQAPLLQLNDAVPR